MIAAILLVNATTAAAQQITDQLRIAEQRNWYVRVSGHTASLGEGRVRFDTAEKPLIGGVPIMPEDIRRVERRTDVGGGWKAGGVVGGIVGGFFGYGMSGLCEYDCGGEGLKGALVFGGIGAIMGSILGQIVGRPTHVWRPVWP